MNDLKIIIEVLISYTTKLVLIGWKVLIKILYLIIKRKLF